MKIKRKNGDSHFPWFLVIVIVVLIILLVLYVTVDTSEIKTCDNDSDCMIYQVSQDPGEFVCAKKGVESSFRDKILMFRHSQEKGLESKPDLCVCEENTCSPLE